MMPAVLRQFQGSFRGVCRRGSSSLVRLRTLQQKVGRTDLEFATLCTPMRTMLAYFQMTLGEFVGTFGWLYFGAHRRPELSLHHCLHNFVPQAVTKDCRGVHTVDSSLAEVSGEFRGSFRGVSGKFQGSSREVSGKFPGSFRGISGGVAAAWSACVLCSGRHGGKMRPSCNLFYCAHWVRHADPFSSHLFQTDVGLSLGFLCLFHKEFLSLTWPLDIDKRNNPYQWSKEVTVQCALLDWVWENYVGEGRFWHYFVCFSQFQPTSIPPQTLLSNTPEQ